MPNIEVLYYPNFEPSKKWIRSHLLFFDTVKSIIPKDDEIELSENILELRDEIPNSFKPLAPRKKDTRIDDLNIERLRKAFLQIRNNEENSSSDKIAIDYSLDKMNFPGRAFLHDGKVSSQVNYLLEDFGLIEKNSQEICDSIGAKNFYLVDKRASDLIVSLVADNIANSRGFNTITDQSISFTLNSLNSFDYNALGNSRSLLSYKLVDDIIPENIEHLSIEEYAVIHDIYEKIHEPFQEVVSNLNTLTGLEDVNDYSILEERMNEITHDFNLEVEEIKNSRTMSNIKKWIPIGLGGLAIISAFKGNIPASAYIGTASLSIQTYNTYKLDGLSKPSRTSVQRMIGNMQKDILKHSQIEALI